MTLAECCLECAKNEELICQFNRLTGYKLGVERPEIVKMIDDACGYNPDKDAMKAFCAFVFESIWTPVFGGCT